MSVNIKQLDGTLTKIAGNTIILDATASEIREGTWTNTSVDIATGDTCIEANITFEVPMPDTNYMVVFDKPIRGHGQSYNYVTLSTKTTTGFTFFVTYTGNLTHEALGLQVHWYAVRLVELEGYTALQNKVSNPDSAPTENSTNLVTSGGVYDAIKNASSVFIGTSSEWESETSKTDYQVAILTDQPTVNAVDSTDGSTTVVGEPNKRWVGTQAEWDNLTAAEKAKYEIVCFNDDNGASGKDIYSTTETKTNKVWIDGKPIYRRVLTGFEITGDSGGWQTISGITIPNAGALVYAAALRITSGVDFAYFHRFDVQILSTGEIRILNLIGELSSPINTIVLEYTKTTD